jgi:hypothetical protein
MDQQEWVGILIVAVSPETGLQMATSALEKAQELEKQRQAILREGADEALSRAIAAFKELRALVDEQLKALPKHR